MKIENKTSALSVLILCFSYPCSIKLDKPSPLSFFLIFPFVYGLNSPVSQSTNSHLLFMANKLDWRNWSEILLQLLFYALFLPEPFLYLPLLLKESWSPVSMLLPSHAECWSARAPNHLMKFSSACTSSVIYSRVVLTFSQCLYC